MRTYKTVLLSILLSVAIPLFAFAETQTAAANTILAQVNVDSAKVANQVGRVLNVAFTLSNRVGVQSDVRYGVRLVGANGAPVDEEVYDEALTLAENSVTHRSVAYEIPSTLSGTYTGYLVVTNAANFPFATVSLGAITAPAGEKWLNVEKDTCTVIGSKDKKQHTLSSVFTVSPDDIFSVSCVVTNTSTATVVATPVIGLYIGSLYGAQVSSTQPVVRTWKPGEKQTITEALPAAKTPGIYVFRFNVMSEAHQTNTVFGRYSVFGNFATITNVSLDKDYYAAGGTAQTTITWNGLLLKPHADVRIESARGALCGTASVESLTKGMQSLSVHISRPCFSPQITVTIKDKDNKILAEQTFHTTTTSRKEVSGFFSGTTGAIVLIVILLALVILSRYIKHKKNIPPVAPIALFILCIVSFPFARAHADQFPVGPSGELTATVNIQNLTHPGQSYQQGDHMQVDATLANNTGIDRTVTMSAITIGNNQVTLFPANYVVPAFGARTGNSQQFTINIQSPNTIPGTYNVDFNVDLVDTTTANPNVDVTNNSLATQLTNLALDGTTVTLLGSGAGYPVPAGDHRYANQTTNPFIDVHIEWYLSNRDPGGHTDIVDTNGVVAGCVIQQKGDPNPKYEVAGVDMTGPLPLTVLLQDGEYCL